MHRFTDLLISMNNLLNMSNYLHYPRDLRAFLPRFTLLESLRPKRDSQCHCVMNSTHKNTAKQWHKKCGAYKLLLCSHLFKFCVRNCLKICFTGLNLVAKSLQLPIIKKIIIFAYYSTDCSLLQCQFAPQTFLILHYSVDSQLFFVINVLALNYKGCCCF